MPGEATNPVSGSDSANPASELGKPYIDPDFAQPDEESEAKPEPDQSGTDPDSAPDDAANSDEDDAREETEETADDSVDEDEADVQSVSLKDDVVISLKDGTKVTLGDLKAGNLRDADYRHKTQALGNERRAVAERASHLDAVTNAIAEHMAKALPPEPDVTLAYSDPGRYVAQKAQYEAAMAQIGTILQSAGPAKAIGAELSDDQHRQLLEAEDAKLATRFPATASKDGRKTFMDGARAAAKSLGYSDKELNGIVDHRTIALAYYAKKGLDAENAAKKTGQKLANVPPVTAGKRPGVSPNSVKALQNVNAMKKLARSGSIADAMAIDFD